MGYQHFYQLKEWEKFEIFDATSKEMSIPIFAVEKDWWVVITLNLIFEMDVAEHLIFKGGTSLSKAWKLIDRFSEDIDLAIERSFFGFNGDIPRSQVKKLRRASAKYIEEKFFPALKKKFEDADFEDVEFRLRAIETPDQDPLIIEIYYPSVTEISDYVEPRVLVEIGCRSLWEPNADKVIQSFIGEQFSDKEFSDDPTTIPSVNPERTYLEKLFLLHEEFQRPKDKIRVDRLSRHLYDIHRISTTDYAKLAVKNIDLYKEIVAHRKKFTRVGGVDYDKHFPPNLNSIPPDECLKDWKKDYKVMQEQMIYGETPSFKKLLEEIQNIVDHINTIEIK